MNHNKFNHDKVRQPKLGKGYCNCDKALVAKGSKCPVCNNKMKGNTRKSVNDVWLDEYKSNPVIGLSDNDGW
jgi:hypothetical protein